MRYHCLHIKTDFAEEWQKDLFDQQLCDLGVDTIDDGSEPQTGHADYYIPSERWEQNEGAIKDLLSSFNFHFSVSPCPDENWNATWEAEHPVQELPLGIRIVPHCAFGAGYHETTSMMIDTLIEHLSTFDFERSGLSTFSVLDHGTGTGVLAIFAKRLGATNVVAVDIDENSVANAQENAALNGETIDVRLGSTPPEGPFDLILANIHRNILLANMPAYAAQLTPKGELWLSGFYESDCEVLKAAAQKEGLSVTDVLARGEWRLMKCQKVEHR